MIGLQIVTNNLSWNLKLWIFTLLFIYTLSYLTKEFNSLKDPRYYKTFSMETQRLF